MTWQPQPLGLLIMLDLSTEQSYLNGEPLGYGTPGSIRIDVGEGTVESPMAVFDLKTGSATLTPARILQVQSQLSGGNSAPYTRSVHDRKTICHASGFGNAFIYILI